MKFFIDDINSRLDNSRGLGNLKIYEQKIFKLKYKKEIGKILERVIIFGEYIEQ